MKIPHVLLALSLLLSPCAQADEAAHRKAAEDLVIASDFATAMRGGFLVSLTPMLDSMRQRGMPEAAITEMREAITKWFDAEVKPAEMMPKVVDIYMGQFTEPELKELLVFYKSPVGRKSITTLPSIMQQSAAIAQAYIQSKQASLNGAITPIVEKYRPQAKAP